MDKLSFAVLLRTLILLDLSFMQHENIIIATCTGVCKGLFGFIYSPQTKV